MSLKCRTNRSAYKYLNITNFISMIELCLGPNIISFFFVFQLFIFSKTCNRFFVRGVHSGFGGFNMVLGFFLHSKIFSRKRLQVQYGFQSLFSQTLVAFPTPMAVCKQIHPTDNRLSQTKQKASSLALGRTTSRAMTAVSEGYLQYITMHVTSACIVS